MRSTDRSPTSRLLQLAVWVLLAALLVTGVALGQSGSPGAPTPTSASATTATAPLAAPTSIVLADPATAQPADTTSQLLCKYTPGGCDGKANNPDAPLNLLPAWRWSGATGIGGHSMGFWQYITGGLLMGIAALMFALAGFLWWVLLAVLRFALSLTIVQMTAHSINSGAYTLGKAILQSPVIWVLFAVGLGALVRAGMKGNLPKILAVIVAFAIPLGALQMITLAASTDKVKTGGTTGTYGDAAGDAIPAGSPAWIAFRGNKLVDTISTDLGTGFGALSATSASSQATTISADGTASPNCDSYIAGLNATYLKAQGLDPNATVAGQVQSGSLASVSYLWKIAFLDSWTVAQFGNTIDGARIACHRLEQQAGITPAEQLAIAQANGYANVTIAPFLMPSDDDEVQSQLFGWAMCKIDPKSSTGFGPTNEAWGSAFGNRTAVDVCKDFFTHAPDGYPTKGWEDGHGSLNRGSGDNLAQWDNVGAINAELATPDKTTDPASVQRFQNARDTAIAWYGGYTGAARMLQGIEAAATAAIYLVALGGMGVGAIIAQVGLMIMLLLLPATICALAIPDSSDKARLGQHPLGKKLLRMTGGFFASKLLLVTAMVLLLQIIDLLMGVIGSGSGMLGGFLHGLIPLAALFALKHLMKGLGLGDITKLSGAVGMAGSAALASSGDKNWARAGQAAMMNSRGMKALDRADHAARAQLKRPHQALGGVIRERHEYGKARRKHERAHKGLEYDKTKGQWVPKAPEKDENGHTSLDYRRQQMRADRLNKKIDRDAHLQNWKKAKEDATRDRRAYLKNPPSDEDVPFGGTGGAAAGTGDRMHALAGDLQATAGKPTDPTVSVETFGNQPKFVAHATVTAALDGERRGADLYYSTLPADEQLNFRAEAVLGSLAQARAGYQGVSAGEAIGVLSPEQQAQAAALYADSIGVRADQVLMGYAGLPPMPAPTTDRRIPEMDTVEATIAAARHPVHYLPADVKARMEHEIDDDSAYQARLVMELQQRALMSGTGELVDMLKDRGIDTETADGRAEVLKASRGEASKLDTITLANDLDMAVRTAINGAVESWRGGGNLQRGVSEEAHHRIADTTVYAREVEEKMNKLVQEAVAAAKEFSAQASFGDVIGDVAELKKDAAKIADAKLLPVLTDLAALTRELQGYGQMVSRPDQADSVAKSVGSSVADQVEKLMRDYKSEVFKLTDVLNTKTADVSDQEESAEQLAALLERMSAQMSDDLKAALTSVERAQEEAANRAEELARLAQRRIARSGDSAAGAGSAPDLG